MTGRFAHQEATPRNSNLFHLSASEKDVLRLVVDGMSNKQISKHRVVSIEKVKNEVKWMLKKTGSVNRGALVRRTIQLCGIKH